MGSPKRVAAGSTQSSSSSSRPLPHECVAVCDALAHLHGRPSLKRDQPRIGCEIQEPHSVLDSLVRTILSQNTTDITSQRAFSQLKADFPTWEDVRTAAAGAVEAAIKVGGLADIKAARIKAILNSLLEQHGALSLEHLRQQPADDIKAQLSSYKGVGPKTIACVLMFCLGRAEFPVDTHVWEISKQLGWVAAGASREQTYEHLNARVPDDIKYDLHVLMVQHGKVCAACGKRGQKRTAPDVPCPLTSFKRSKGYSSSTSEAAAGSKFSKAGSSKAVSKKQKVVDAAAAGAASAAVAAAAAVVVKLEERAAAPAVSSRRRSCRSKQQHAPVEQTYEEDEKPCPVAIAAAAAAAAVAAGVRIKPDPDEPTGAAVTVKQEVDV